MSLTELVPPRTPVDQAERGRGHRGLRRPNFSSEFLVAGVVVVVVAFLSLVPVIYLLAGTFFPRGSFTLEVFREAYSSSILLDMAKNSLVYSIGATVLATVVGTGLAYLVARTDVPMKGLAYAAALVPMIIPGVLHTIAWIFLGSPQIGAVNKLVEPLLGPGFFNIFSMGGMIFVEGIHMAPLTFLLMFAAFKNMDPALEEAALMSGSKPMAVFLRVTLPLVKPALALSTLILFIRAFASFEVPALLGQSSGIWVFTSRIYFALSGYPADYATAGAYSVLMLAVLAAFTVWQARLNKNAKSYQTISGKGFRPSTVPLRGFRRIAGAGVLVYFVISSLLPVLMLVYSSLLGYYAPPTLSAFGRMGLENYVELFMSPTTVSAFTNSILLAVGSATIVMLLTAVIAWLVVRGRIRGGAVLNGLAMVPIGIPGLILGVAMLFFYLRVPLPIYGTLLILLISYVTVFLPFGLSYATSAMFQISAQLEESAKVSGASWFYLFRRVTLPLLMPGLLAGWTFIVLVAVRELGASLLLYSPGDEVLSVVIWQQWSDGRMGQLSALGVVMIAMLALLVAGARKLGANVGVQSP
ncbi:ABC transporter permease [Mycolicibacterium goodii]|uniref:ABC transporter permease n=1 Tax=Mycolicibacterium goodii TaxID=134601 RepID=A0A0K0X8H6_MYCGD|nr:ABC transporter permease [Mycolicibacterium goodii]